MEKKQTTSSSATPSNPLGVCEKIFHAIHTNATFRPLRRLTFRNENANTNTSPPFLDHHAPNSDTKHSSTPMKPHGKKTPLESVRAEKIIAEAKPKAAKLKKEMNQKIEEFISRTKGKIRTGSTVGRGPFSK